MTTDKPEMKVSFNEYVAIIDHLKELADEEGTTLSALIRRAIRKQYFSVSIAPISGSVSVPPKAE